MTELVTTEVLKPGQRTLRELADEASSEHDLMLAAGAAAVEHAIKAGEALLEIRSRVRDGGWGQWVADNLAMGMHWTAIHMRLARYQDEVRSSGITTINGARRHLASLEAPRLNGAWTTTPTWMPKEAARLRYEEGMSARAVGRELGVSSQTVLRWTDPRYAERAKQSLKRCQEKRTAAARALRERERDQAIRRAVRKAGAATAETWTMVQRLQDVIAQAHRENTDVEARRALAEMQSLNHKMNDLAVRALGVQ